MEPFLKLRPRQPSDLAPLEEILHRVYKATGYPVQGPAAFDQFLNLDPSTVLHSTVALFATPSPTACLSEPDTEGQIIGQLIIMKPSRDNPALASKVHIERGGSWDDHAVVSRFFVDPDVQAKGVGAEMLREATRWARFQGIRLSLLVLEKDQRAIRLYEREGWEKVGDSTYTNPFGEVFPSFAYLGPRV